MNVNIPYQELQLGVPYFFIDPSKGVILETQIVDILKNDKAYIFVLPNNEYRYIPLEDLTKASNIFYTYDEAKTSLGSIDEFALKQQYEAVVKKAISVMEKHVEEAYKALEKAQNVADEFGLTFNFDVAYGMGGSYDGNKGDWTSSSDNC